MFLAAAEKATLAAAAGYALTTYLITAVCCIASDASIATVTSWCIAEKLLLTHIMIMKIFIPLPRLLIIMFDPSKFHYFTHQYLPILQYCLLLLHVAAGTARHHTPSSIYDGALAVLVQPSFTLWKVVIQTPIIPPASIQLGTFPATGP
jgi:hypothetical protein